MSVTPPLTQHHSYYYYYIIQGDLLYIHIRFYAACFVVLWSGSLLDASPRGPHGPFPYLAQAQINQRRAVRMASTLLLHWVKSI